MGMLELQTERLTIRPLNHGDLETVLRVLRVAANDPGERSRVDRYVRYNALAAIVLADMDQPPYGDRAVVLRSSGGLIGLAGLVPTLLPYAQLQEIGREPVEETIPAALNQPEVGLYYEIDPDHRAKGYATEAAAALAGFALETLGCSRIVATTERANHPSQAVMRHLGMRLLENPLPEPAWLEVAGVLARTS